MDDGRFCAVLRSVAVLVMLCGSASSAEVQGVSPGEVDRIVEVEGRCPAFSWEAAPDAELFELVVYRLPEQPAAGSLSHVELTADDEVLYVRLPGGATGWTPSLEDCFEVGRGYVWFVRAVQREDGPEVLEVGEWSVGRFFSLSSAPTVREVEQALDVLRRYVGDGSASFSRAGQPAGAAGPPAAARSVTTRPRPVADRGSKAMTSAKTAIRGNVSDTVGETYGVVGISSSPDGAGVGAANTDGGPDLVLDGSADAETDTLLAQDGIFRSSGSPETFTIANPGAGTITLDVQGTVAGNGSGLTGVDADTLDGTEGSLFATEAEAAALVATHAASADHDGRYFTENELKSYVPGGAVAWGNLRDVPPGFADGTDDDTTYSAGPGLDLADSTLGWSRLNLVPMDNTISTIDSGGAVGGFISITIGADGLGLISYYDYTNADLKVAHCNDRACTSATTTTIDSAGMVGAYSSIAIGSDGLGLISYYDGTNFDLKVAHCNNLACTSASTVTIDSADDVGAYSSIAIDQYGRGLISYYDATNDDLKVARCYQIDCSTSAHISTLDSVGDVGRHTSIAIGSTGRGMISYRDTTNQALKFAHCAGIYCESAAITTIDSTGNVGEYSAITLGADGLPLINYYDRDNDLLKSAHCSLDGCSPPEFVVTTSEILNVLSSGDTTKSLTVGVDGFGFFCYERGGDLLAAYCHDRDCTSVSNLARVDDSGSVAGFCAVTIGTDGRPLIAYLDMTDLDLKVAHCGNEYCAPYFKRR